MKPSQPTSAPACELPVGTGHAAPVPHSEWDRAWCGPSMLNSPSCTPRWHRCPTIPFAFRRTPHGRALRRRSDTPAASVARSLRDDCARWAVALQSAPSRSSIAAESFARLPSANELQFAAASAADADCRSRGKVAVPRRALGASLRPKRSPPRPNRASAPTLRDPRPRSDAAGAVPG
jgi:hypothetical protein